MKLSSGMMLNAVVSGLFGLAFVLVPAQSAGFYGVTTDKYHDFVLRLFGCALLGYSVLTWLCRNAENSPVRRSIVIALMISNGTGFIVSLLGQLGGLMNSLGWVTVAIYLILTGGYAYFFLNKS